MTAVKRSSLGVIEVAMIGLGTVESIPLFHYNPGGIVLRVALIGYQNPVFHCDSFPICVFGKGARLLAPVPIDAQYILDKARQWGVNTIIFDGLEPIKTVDRRAWSSLLKEIRSSGYAVGARTMGLLEENDIIMNLDFIIIDYVKDYIIDPSMPAESIKLIYKLKENSRDTSWIEVSAYLKDPDYWKLHPLILALEDAKDIPLHVFIENHKGGGPVRDLYQELKRRLDYVYIHNDLYPKLDTLCPRCDAPIASRDEGVLRALEVEVENRCWKCGYPIPFKGNVRKKTPEHILLSTDEGGVRWYHPSQLLGNQAYWRNRM